MGLVHGAHPTRVAIERLLRPDAVLAEIKAERVAQLGVDLEVSCGDLFER